MELSLDERERLEQLRWHGLIAPAGNWLKRQLDQVAEDAKTWPAWKREEAEALFRERNP